MFFRESSGGVESGAHLPDLVDGRHVFGDLDGGEDLVGAAGELGAHVPDFEREISGNDGAVGADVVGFDGRGAVGSWVGQ